jgi:pyruvate carboxylase
MTGTFTLRGVVNGKLYEIGKPYDSFTISLTGDVITMAETAVTLAGTAEQIAAIGTEALFIVVIPEMAGTLSWGGATAADNSSIRCIANVPVFLPSGDTTEYAATNETRAEGADAAITALYYDADVDGQVRVFIGR